MSFQFCDLTAADFYRKIEWMSHTHQSLPRDIFENESDETKFSRKITHLPFSILVLQSAQENSQKRYYILSDMHISEPGSLGRIKVGYPMQVQANTCKIDFTRPTAVKITAKIGSVSEDAQHFMSEIFKNIYSLGIWKRHTEEGDRSKLYYTMPLYRGQELFDYLNLFHSNNQPMGIGRAINIILHLALEVQKIHRAGYVYWDIKPENIMRYDNKELKTLDIKLIDWDSLSRANQLAPLRGRAIGTPEFMAPELKRACSSGATEFMASYTLDIYSLGKTFETILEVAQLHSDQLAYINKHLITSMLKQRISIDEVVEKIERIFPRDQLKMRPGAGI